MGPVRTPHTNVPTIVLLLSTVWKCCLVYREEGKQTRHSAPCRVIVIEDTVHRIIVAIITGSYVMISYVSAGL